MQKHTQPISFSLHKLENTMLYHSRQWLSIYVNDNWYIYLC